MGFYSDRYYKKRKIRIKSKSESITAENFRSFRAFSVFPIAIGTGFSVSYVFPVVKIVF